jgi:hypothetical protein
MQIILYFKCVYPLEEFVQKIVVKMFSFVALTRYEIHFIHLWFRIAAVQ